MAIVALFQEQIRAWFIRPKLDVSVDVAPPDCVKIPTLPKEREPGDVAAAAYYLRFRVINNGSMQAKSVEVFASELWKLQADDVTFTPVTSFLPMNLSWADYGVAVFPAIPAKMYRYCNLAHIIDPDERARFPGEDKIWDGIPRDRTILSFATILQPYSQSYLVPFGKYRLHVLIFAANVRPIKKILEISLPGNWYDEPLDMFQQGIGVRVID